MRIYNIYLRGQVKPLVFKENLTNEEKKTSDTIKNLSKFILNKLSTCMLVTEKDVLICQPSDLSGIHVTDQNGFSKEELELSKEDRLVKEITFGDLEPEYLDKPKVVQQSPQIKPESVKKPIPEVKLPSLEENKVDNPLFKPKRKINPDDYPVIPSRPISAENLIQ